MRKTLMISILALAAASCGRREPPDREANLAAAENQVNTVAAIDTLPEGMRNGVFIRAIRDASQECQAVESSRQLGSSNGRTMWEATCQSGTAWRIVVGPDGNAAVMPGNAQ